MELGIGFDALVFNIIGNHVQIAIATYGVDVIAVCPEFLFPKERLHFWMLFKYHPCCNAFDDVDHS